jgi:hypothetical protein
VNVVQEGGVNVVICMEGDVRCEVGHSTQCRCEGGVKAGVRSGTANPWHSMTLKKHTKGIQWHSTASTCARARYMRAV